MRRFIAAAILCCLPAVVSADPAVADTRLHALLTGDATRGWEAVGRIDIGRSGFCTGALIADNIVLTAAHCIYDSATGEEVPAADFRFLAGWRNGRADAYRGVRRVMAHPEYVFDGTNKMDRVACDIALLELDQPIRLPSIQPFATGGEPMAGDTVGVVSYALNRSEAPSLQEGCDVLGRQPGVLVITCDVDFGSSGAPIFSIHDGTASIVSVVSAKAEMDSRRVALGTDMQGPLADLRKAFAAGSGAFRRVVPGANPGFGGAGAAGGAKFVTP